MKPLLPLEESLILAAYYRANLLDDPHPTACCDQVITLSLFYTCDVSDEDCIDRFINRGYIKLLWKNDDEDEGLETGLSERYAMLIHLINERSDLIEGFGNLSSPAYPCYTACRLTLSGEEIAKDAFTRFPAKPLFANWPDRRAMNSRNDR